MQLQARTKIITVQMFDSRYINIGIPHYHFYHKFAGEDLSWCILEIANSSSKKRPVSGYLRINEEI